MKDLRDYYKSPPKAVIGVQDDVGVKDADCSATENAHPNESTEKSIRETTSGSIEVNEDGSSIKNALVEVANRLVTNSKDDPTSKDEKENARKGIASKHKRKGRKSKASRKPSDPAVKTITELLNASLTIISPNTSVTSSKKDSAQGGVEEHLPSTENIKSPRTSSMKNKSRRSSSDFQIPTSLSKQKSKLSLSGRKEIGNETSGENCNKNGTTETKIKSRKPSSDFTTSDSHRKEKLETKRNDKNIIDKDKISVDTRGESPIHIDGDTTVSHKNSSLEKPVSRKTERKRKRTKKGKVQEVNKTTINSTKDTIKDQNKVEDSVVIDYDELSESVNNDKSSQEIPKPKIDAFQFMMDSRFKSIGQNLNGKEVNANETTEEDKDSKQKRLSRKLMLENWTETKTNMKRKHIEEEEKDIYINYQLEKRAKRLKKLLNPHDDNCKENVKDKPAVVKSTKKSLRKRVIKPVIPSDSESSSDFVELKQNKNKSKLSRDKSLKNKDNNKTSILNKESGNSQKGILSFLGITDKLKMQHIENKNTVREESMSSETKVSKKSGKEPKKSKLVSSDKTRELAIEENANLDLPTEQHAIIQTHTEKQASQSSIDACEKSCSQDSIGPGKGFQTPKLKKHRKKETMEDHLLGRSPRGWKMKIRITDDEGTSTSDSFAVRKDICSEDGEQEVNNKKQDNLEQLDELKRERPRRKVAGTRISEVMLSSDSDGEFEIVSPQKRPGRSLKMNLAPVFVKATPRPKIDPKVAQARREFLMSGVPDQLKRDMERQISVEDIDVEVFPAVSHVQQKSPDNIYWDIQSPELNLMSLSPLKSNTINLIYHELTSKHIVETISGCKTFQKLEVCKQFIEQIKSKNPDYPVYKCFRSIYEKSGLKNRRAREKLLAESTKRKTPKQRRGKKKKENLEDSVEIIENPTEKFDISEFAMWTEKYKPTACSDIIGNISGVTQLKKWLEKWTEPLEESIQRKKRKRNGSTSESEFEYVDGDSRGSTSDSKNTVILNGPNGSGKTSAVYAICTELGMNVLELNASSKRTGKRLLQELQEATRSHQVVKGDSIPISQFLKIEKPKDKCQDDDQHPERNKICVLLVEDIDVIFEQDEGFLSALTQLIATSKRPIVLTTTDNASPIICRFTTQHTVIEFKPLAARVLSVWLHILCLIEGVSVDVQCIGHLLDKNNGDVRKTMLELQYWVQTGGNRNRVNQELVLFARSAEEKQRSSQDKLEPDDNSNMSFVVDNDAPKNDLESHTGCLESFEITSRGKPFNIPYRMGLSKIWWNLPHIFSLHSDELPQKHADDAVATVEDKKHKRLRDRRKLDAICKIYDSLLMTDLLKSGKDCLIDLEPCPRQWENALKDSLELTENLDNYSSHHDLTEDICHTLTDGCIDLYKTDNQTSYSINMGLPSIKDKRWREKQHLCEDILQDALSYSNYVNRQSVSVDFMPILRQIGRSEKTRSSQNSKRGNRFNHYLRGLGIDGGDNSYEVVCNVLNVDKFRPSC